MSTDRYSIPSYVRKIQPYVPGKPEEELIREMNLDRVIKMASNENCLGPSPLALEAMKTALTRVHRYPDGSCYYLRNAVSRKFGVPFDQIILGNGSTDLVEILARTYLEPHNNSITADQTFLMYRIATMEVGANCIQVPVRNYTYDLDGILDAIDDNTRIIYIANPNNPTGTMFYCDAWETFLKAVPSRVLVVLDEAYLEYVEGGENVPNGLHYRDRYPNLILLRTFSKIYGLAGIRIGYGIANQEIITNMNRVRSPFNTNVVAQAAGEAALMDEEHLARSRHHNQVEREFLQSELAKRKVPFVPSVTNFVFLPVADSTGIYERLLKQGVIVRPMRSFNQTEGLRVSIGTHEENVTFLDALSTALRG